jgi:hypothetical protein
MMVLRQIITLQGNKPVMGIVQDALLGLKQLWTGIQLFSLIIPCVNLTRLAKGHSDNNTKDRDALGRTDTCTIIEQGGLLCGMIDKKRKVSQIHLST